MNILLNFFVILFFLVCFHNVLYSTEMWCNSFIFDLRFVIYQWIIMHSMCIFSSWWSCDEKERDIFFEQFLDFSIKKLKETCKLNFAHLARFRWCLLAPNNCTDLLNFRISIYFLSVVRWETSHWVFMKSIFVIIFSVYWNLIYLNKKWWMIRSIVNLFLLSFEKWEN